MGAVLLHCRRDGVRRGSGRRGRTRRGKRSSADPTKRSRAACRALPSELHPSESEPTMKLMAVVMAASLAGAFAPDRAWSGEPLERYALIVGANSGSRDRPQLKYAISDAERFARVLVELGGVA